MAALWKLIEQKDFPHLILLQATGPSAWLLPQPNPAAHETPDVVAGTLTAFACNMRPPFTRCPHVPSAGWPRLLQEVTINLLLQMSGFWRRYLASPAPAWGSQRLKFCPHFTLILVRKDSLHDLQFRPILQLKESCASEIRAPALQAGHVACAWPLWPPAGIQSWSWVLCIKASLPQHECSCCPTACLAVRPADLSSATFSFGGTPFLIATTHLEPFASNWHCEQRIVQMMEMLAHR